MIGINQSPMKKIGKNTSPIAEDDETNVKMTKRRRLKRIKEGKDKDDDERGRTTTQEMKKIKTRQL